MNKKWLVVAAVLTLTACSEEAQKEMKQAAEHAKAAVAETNKKWGEMNTNRLEDVPNEQPNLPSEKVDMEKLKQGISDAKETVKAKIDEYKNN